MSKAHPSKQTPVAAAVAGLADQWVEVFKAGTHIDAKGKQQSFSRADLDQMVTNHELGAAPAVIGHPKHNAPAYAWVDEYKRDGDSLFAKFKDINPAFETGIKAGAYRNRSVSVYPDKGCGWRVRHVGWLGAEPPAIDGLQPVDFSAADDACMEFSAPGYSLVWGLESSAKLMRRLRDRMIEKDGLEAADATLPQWEIDAMNESATSARAQFNNETKTPSLFSNPTGDDDMSITKEDMDKAVADAKAAGEAAGKATAEAAAKLEFSAQQAKVLKIEKERQGERIATQIKGWKDKGMLLPANEAGLAEFMAQLDDAGGEFTFSKAEGGGDVKKTPAQFFSDFMATVKPVVKLGSPGLGGKGVDPIDTTSPQQLADLAMSYMKQQADKGITVSLPDAMTFAAAGGNG
ncbi:MAG: hypothetical protein V4772_25895 [Pseudomonadota bacterium]